MKGCIGIFHWEACKTCKNEADDGACFIESSDFSCEMGDFLVCGEYEEKERKENEDEA